MRMGVEQNKPNGLARLVAFAAGLIQAIVAFSLLFLPVFAECMGTPEGGPLSCRRLTYLQQGGDASGFFVFGLMLVLGSASVVTSFMSHRQWICFVRWSLIVASFMIACIAFSGIGLSFIPAALLMLLPAISCSRQ